MPSNLDKNSQVELKPWKCGCAEEFVNLVGAGAIKYRDFREDATENDRESC